MLKPNKLAKKNFLSSLDVSHEELINLFNLAQSFKNTDKLILLNQASIFFTIFCIYFFYNSLNFSDGYNGISITLSLYILITFFLIFYKNI